MDLINQNLEVANHWAELQLQAWTGWLDAVQKADKFDPAVIWAKTLETCQETVQGTLEAQGAGSQLLFEEVASVKGFPKEAVDLAEYMQDLTEQWLELQGQFYDDWFALLKRADIFDLTKKLLRIELAQQ